MVSLSYRNVHDMEIVPKLNQHIQNHYNSLFYMSFVLSSQAQTLRKYKNLARQWCHMYKRLADVKSNGPEN